MRELIQMKVCVVIPVYKPIGQLDEDEQLSWRQCLRVLYRHTICLAGPKSLDISGYIAELTKKKLTYQVELFGAAAFASIDGYNRLMLSKNFYQRFLAYEYMLTYQLDAFIFRDDIAVWCSRGYSYVGAPWFEGFLPTDTNARLWAVGNGGFTLRRIPDALRVLTEFATIWTWPELKQQYFSAGRKRGLQNVPAFLNRLLLGNNTHWLLNKYHEFRSQHQEDYFWGVVCSHKFAWFKVPLPQQALEFSFEVAPRKMFELNGYRLAMGCHAWRKHDFAFWESYLAECKAQLNLAN